MSRQATCKERLPFEYRRELARIKTALGWNNRGAKWFDSNSTEDRYSEYIEGVLTFDRDTTMLRGVPKPRWLITDEDGASIEPDYAQAIGVELSTGGPADGFVLFARKNDNGFWVIERAYYYFQDWFDGAHCEVTGRNLEAIRDMFGEWISN